MGRGSRGLLWTSLASVVLLGLWGDPATAEVFCVNKPSCTGTSMATIQEALDAAELNGQTDTVLVGANESIPYVENLTYDDPETVHLIGEGPTLTIVQGTEAGANTVTLLSPTSTIESMTLRAPDVIGGAGLRWNGSASDLKVLHLGSVATPIYGMTPEGNAKLADSIVDVNGQRLFRMTAGTVTVENSQLTGKGVGITASGGDLTLSRSTITTDRSALETTGDSQVTVENSILKVIDNEVGEGAISAQSGSTVLARHVTMIGSGTGNGVVANATSESIDVAVFDSIITGFQQALHCAGAPPNTTNLEVAYSNWREPTDLADDGCNETIGAGNDTVTEPVFVGLRLVAPSPLIDAAEPAGDPLELDLAAEPREVDGDGIEGARPDMGAYEYQRRAPEAFISVVGPREGGQPLSFTAAGSADSDPGDVLSYSWDFGDGTTASGFSAHHTFSGLGRHTVTLTVADPTGLTGTDVATVFFNTLEAPRPPRLFDLRVFPKRVKPGQAKPALVLNGKRGILFDLSADAMVTLSLQRCTGRTGCAKRTRVAGSKTFAAPAGAHSIVFKGRMSGAVLPPGRYLVALKAANGNQLTTRLRLLR